MMYCSKSSGLWIVPKQFLTLGLLMVNVLVTNKCFVCAKVFVTVRTVVTECVGKVLGFHMVFDNPKLFLLIRAQLTAKGSCLQSLNKLFKVFRFWDRPWKIILWGKRIKQKYYLFISNNSKFLQIIFMFWILVIKKCFVCSKYLGTEGTRVGECIGEVFGLDMVPCVGPPGQAEGTEGAGERAVPDTHNVLVKILGGREGALKTHCHCQSLLIQL